MTDADANTMSFDLACWFSGMAAAIAAAEDGEESPPPNDYYIRNDSNQLRTVLVAASASVAWLPTGDPADIMTGTYEEWIADRPVRSYLPGVWIEIEDGEVTLIEEQYVP